MAKKHEYFIDKYDQIRADVLRYEEYMCEEMDVLCVAYGSVSRVVMGTVRKLREQGLKVGLLRPITLWPFPYDIISKLAQQAKTTVVFEMSWGQMVEDVALAMRMNPNPLHFVPKHGGLTFTPHDVEDVLHEILADHQHPNTLWQPH
jgi:2-oxoglutarate ferredoxin oxidoreductase subunit alpha